MPCSDGLGYEILLPQSRGGGDQKDCVWLAALTPTLPAFSLSVLCFVFITQQEPWGV